MAEFPSFGLVSPFTQRGLFATFLGKLLDPFVKDSFLRDFGHFLNGKTTPMPLPTETDLKHLTSPSCSSGHWALTSVIHPAGHASSCPVARQLDMQTGSKRAKNTMQRKDTAPSWQELSLAYPSPSRTSTRIKCKVEKDFIWPPSPPTKNK